MKTRVIVCCGAGGVGKTTASASLALSLARSGRKVAVITIDPARRLADALGIGELTNEPRRVPLAEGAPNGGYLDAMMLDMKATFDSVIRRHAPDQESCDRLLESKYYKFVSERLAGSHEYMAMERLYQLYHDPTWDVIVVDTPPSRHAIDFVRSPARLGSVMSEGVVRWMSLPKNSIGLKLFEKGSSTVTGVLKKLVGAQTVTEIAQFFELISGMAAGFRERSASMLGLLKSEGANFLLITTAAPASLDALVLFEQELSEEGLPLGGVLINRVTPEPAGDPAALPVWQSGPLPLERWEQLRRELGEVAERQWLQRRADLAVVESLRSRSTLWTLPTLPHGTDEVEALERLSAKLSDCANHLAPIEQTP